MAQFCYFYPAKIEFKTTLYLKEYLSNVDTYRQISLAQNSDCFCGLSRPIWCITIFRTENFHLFSQRKIFSLRCFWILCNFEGKCLFRRKIFLLWHFEFAVISKENVLFVMFLNSLYSPRKIFSLWHFEFSLISKENVLVVMFLKSLYFPRKIFSFWHFEFSVISKEKLLVVMFLILYIIFSKENLLVALFWILCIKFSLGNTMIGFRFPFANTPSLLPSHMFLTYFEPLVSEKMAEKSGKCPENMLENF